MSGGRIEKADARHERAASDFTITNPARWIGQSPRYANYRQQVCITHRLWQFLPGQSLSVYPRWQVVRH